VSPLTIALAVAALGGVAVSAAVVTLIIVRVDAYNGDATYLRAGHAVPGAFPAGQYVVFVGCTQDINCPSLRPADLSVTTAGGRVVRVGADLSSDHLSEDAQPFIGQLAFSLPAGRRSC